MKKDDIKFDKRNYRRHSEENKKLIRKSLEEAGMGRSIVIDKNNEIICGNGVFGEAKEMDIPIRVIETDGSELIVTKRVDLDTGDDKRRQLAVMDNSTSDTSAFDIDLLKADFTIERLGEMGIEIKEKDKDKEENPEVLFTEELLEEHNYVVLYFDNSVDWLQAQTVFDIKPVKSLDSKKGFEKIGVGRVINGAKALHNLRETIKKGG